MILKYEIDETIKVKEYLTKVLSANLIQTLNEKGANYLVNNQLVKNYYVMNKGDVLQVVIPVIDTNVKPQKGEIEILYEDDYLLIINKEHDVATIPTRMHYDHSLANFVAYYYVTKGINAGIHFVNRLDAATSGIIVVAKNPYVAENMKDAIEEKKYYALLWGNVEKDGVVRTTIVKDENSIIKRKNIEGESAFTSYNVVKKYDDKTLVLATLHTGKTHQLRLHFNYIGHNIVGDKLYGNDNEDILHLHSSYLKFIHPITKKVVEINSFPKWIEE